MALFAEMPGKQYMLNERTTNRAGMYNASPRPKSLGSGLHLGHIGRAEVNNVANAEAAVPGPWNA